MNKIYLLTAMLLVAAAAMAGVSAPQRGPQKLAHGLPVPVVKPATNVSDAGSQLGKGLRSQLLHRLHIYPPQSAG